MQVLRGTRRSGGIQTWCWEGSQMERWLVREGCSGSCVCVRERKKEAGRERWGGGKWAKGGVLGLGRRSGWSWARRKPMAQRGDDLHREICGPVWSWVG